MSSAAEELDRDPELLKTMPAEPYDPVEHPKHYVSNPSGVECIQVTQWMNFCVGNAVKYLWRVDDKGDPIENLRKARQYIDLEIARRRGGQPWPKTP